MVLHFKRKGNKESLDNREGKLYICGVKVNLMAHIIRNTPVLKGKNAENFVENLLTKKTPSESKRKQMEKDVAYLRSIATFKF